MLKFCLIISVVGSVYCQEILRQKNVHVLTEDNFESFIANNEYCLVTFYAPWCGPCRMLKPEFEEAARLLSEVGSKAKLGKVDATVHKSIASEHVVRGYPTIKFFRKGSSMDYTGGRMSKELFKWVLKKSQPALHVIKSTADSNVFTSDKSEDIKIIGFFADSNAAGAKVYRSVAEAADNFKFGITSSSEVFSLHKAADKQLAMFRKFDKSNPVFKGPYTEYSIKRFIEEESSPPIFELSHQNVKRVLSGQPGHVLFLFFSRRKGHYETHIEGLYPIQKEYKDKILFVTIDDDDPTFTKFIQFFKLGKDQMPLMRILRIKGPTRFKPLNNEFTPKSVGIFLEDYFNDKAKEDLLEQELPSDWDAKPVKILVTSNFDKIVFDKSKTVMVDFFAPWCGPCRLLEPEYNKLGKMFKDNGSVVIAKLDATQNELAHTKIQTLPTIKLYTKKNKVIDYSGGRTAQDMARFIQKHAK